MVKLMYSVFLGLIIAIFVGTGVATFYKGPVQPEFPDSSIAYDEQTGEPTNSELAKQINQEYQDAWDAYDDSQAVYNRNIAIVTMAVAVILLIVGVTQSAKLEVVGDGVLLGGVFTLLYSLIRGLMSNDDIVRFLVITVGLLIALWLGYKKFMPKSKAAAK